MKYLKSFTKLLCLWMLKHLLLHTELYMYGISRNTNIINNSNFYCQVNAQLFHRDRKKIIVSFGWKTLLWSVNISIIQCLSTCMNFNKTIKRLQLNLSVYLVQIYRWIVKNSVICIWKEIYWAKDKKFKIMIYTWKMIKMFKI